MSEKRAGVGSPLTFADVDTNGRPSRRQSCCEKGSRVILIAALPSAASISGASPRGCSKITVVGRSERTSSLISADSVPRDQSFGVAAAFYGKDFLYCVAVRRVAADTPHRVGWICDDTAPIDDVGTAQQLIFEKGLPIHIRYKATEKT